MRNKYRIVTDEFNGYEAQVKRWWWPFWWVELNGVNTSSSIQRAYKYVEEDRKGSFKPFTVWSDA